MTKQKILNIRCGGESQEDECPRLVSEYPKSRGLEDDCMGDEGPHWTVAPDQ